MRKGIIANAVAIILMLITALAVGLYFGENSSSRLSSPGSSANLSTPIPFDYYLDVFPVNGTVRQGNSISTSINITYIQGSAQYVTLSASGVPEGATFSFSNQTGTPSSTDIFTSNLTINIPVWVPTGVYSINVNSTVVDGEKYSISYTLTVLDAEIQVSGTVEINSNNDTWPAQLQFINADSTYTANVHLNMTTPNKFPVQKGTYNISLPNHQNYTVICIWNSFGAQSDQSGWSPDPSKYDSGKIYCETLSVNCDVGVTSMKQDYSL
jgi:hypothetical protein